MVRFLRRIGAWLAVVSLYVSPVNAQTWENLLTTVRRKFPGVRQLSTAELSAWLSDTNAPAKRPKPLLIDARAASEFEVSHLRGARHAETVEAVRLLRTDPNQPVVVYCSVGYRSSALAERLQAAGIQQVWNLEGSLFAWANEGRPVYRGEVPVQGVHPYDAKWGRLLDPRHHPAARVPGGSNAAPR